MPSSVYSTSEVDALVGELDDRVTALEAGGGPGPTPPPAQDVIGFGVSFGGIGYTDDAGKRARMMDDVIAMGAVSLRMQLWRQTQCVDAIHQAVGKGLDVLTCVMPDYSSTVIDRARAKSYGTEAANAIGDVVDDLEFWNEPDLTGTWTPEQWAQAAVGFQEGVEASQHPELRIWQGALWTWKMNEGSTTQGAYEWWRQAYDEWDRMGVSGLPGFGCSGHGYGDTGWDDPRNALWGYFGPDYDGQADDCIRALMDRNGDEGKPIVLTECGNGDPKGQPAAVSSMFNLMDSGPLDSFQVYSQWDDAAGTFGMRPAEGQTPRQAYGIYQSRASGVVGGARRFRSVPPGPTPWQLRGDIPKLPKGVAA